MNTHLSGILDEKDHEVVKNNEDEEDQNSLQGS